MKLKIKYSSKKELAAALSSRIEVTSVQTSETALEIVKALKQSQFGSVQMKDNQHMLQLHMVARLYASIVFPGGNVFVEHDGIDTVYFGPEKLIPERVEAAVAEHVEELHKMAPQVQMPTGPGGFGGGHNPFGPQP